MLLLPHLSQLAHCPTLTRLSVTSSYSNLEEVDAAMLGRLSALTHLSLRFSLQPKTAPARFLALKVLPLLPFSQLTNLQQLVVRGITPEQPTAAGVCCLPSSLTSLTLEGEGTYGEAADEMNVDGSRVSDDMLRSWLKHLSPHNSLQQLILLSLPSVVDWGVDFGCVPQLQELICLFAASDSVGATYRISVPPSFGMLRNLRNFTIETYKAVWPQHAWDASRQQQLFAAGCTHLQQLGHVIQPSLFEEGMDLSHLQRLSLFASSNIPGWLTAAGLPLLRELHYEGISITPAIIQGLAAFTQLTGLRLNLGWSFERSLGTGCLYSLDQLGSNLCNLVRLELVGCHRKGQRLIVPELASFTQIKQLQLQCFLNPAEKLPVQPSASDFYEQLSPLTQLEQLQLLGYSTVTPALCHDLVDALPQLQLLEVGLCKHPELMKALQQAQEQKKQLQQGVGCGAGVLGEDGWRQLHVGFAGMEGAWQLQRPHLKVKVGLAQQWL